MNFIGKTGVIAKVLEPKVQSIRDRITRHEPVPVLERRWLFTGPPGVGKTALAEYLALLLAGGNSMNIDKLNGQNVSIETVRHWQQCEAYRPMFGGAAVTLVDEIDASSKAALNDLRTHLDRLGQHRVFLATTNLPVAQLQEQLQSRFQVFQFKPVPSEEIARHIAGKYELDETTAQRIAFGSGGNVRAAELDALTANDFASLTS